MTLGKIATGTAFVGAALTVAAVIWWAILYTQVYFNTGMPILDTVPCMVYTSDLCSLAVALCKGSHFLGITWYSTDLLWLGVAAIGSGLVVNTFGRRT